MKTIIERIDTVQLNIDTIKKAGDILKSGGLVAFPTETVYGLGARRREENLCRKGQAIR